MRLEAEALFPAPGCGSARLGSRNDFRTDCPGSRVLARRMGVGRGRRRVAGRPPRRHRADAARSRVGRRRPLLRYLQRPRRRHLRGGRGGGGSGRARRPQRGRRFGLRRERPHPRADRGDGLRRFRPCDGRTGARLRRRREAPPLAGGARSRRRKTSTGSARSSSRRSGGGPFPSRAPRSARPPS